MKNRKRAAEDMGANNRADSGGIFGFSSPRKRSLRSHQEGASTSANYPETMSQFTYGIKSDIFDMINSGASALGSTVRMFFPLHSVTDESTEDTLNEIEMKSQGSNMTPQCHTPSSTPSKSAPSPLRQKVKDSKAAIRMRCSNLWNETNIAHGIENTENALDTATHGGFVDKTPTRKNNGAKAKKGGKVSLTKLAKNSSIQYFPCGNGTDNLIVLGNIRMIHCKKNNDKQETATIIWSEKFQEIASCAISCSIGQSSSEQSGRGKLLSKVDITTRDNEVFSVNIEDTNLCIQVMQIIQKRCLPTAAIPNNVENATNNEDKECKNGSSPTGLAPLAIGSSPKKAVKRSAQKRCSKSRLMVKISTPSQEEGIKSASNMPINPLPPPPKAFNVEKNLIEFEEYSEEVTPTKKPKISKLSEQATSSPPKNHNEPLPRHLEKYLRMIKTGVPKAAVRHKMELEGIATENISLLIDSSETFSAPSSQDSFATRDVEKCTSKIHGIVTDGLDKVPAAKSQNAEQSGELPAKLKKFQTMLKTGVPADAVRQKMTLEGVSTDDMNKVLGGKSQNAKQSGELPAKLKKFQTMLKTGVPADAVRQKMTLEGVSTDDMNKVLGGKSQNAEQSGELPAKLKKFQTMLKTGVPADAVRQKMTLEGISSNDQSLVLGNSSSSGAQPSGSKPTGPQLLGLHWEPISSDDASISNSVWGVIHNSELETKSYQLEKKEYDTLSSIFTRKQSVKTQKKGNSVPASDRKLRSKTNAPTVIDMSRCTNVSIGMSSFKQKDLTTDKIVDAIKNLDTTTLQHDDLLRLWEITPTALERKSFRSITCAKTKDSFHETEKWLSQLSHLDDCNDKIEAMLFITNFPSCADCIKQKLEDVHNVLALVMRSDALREVMKCILAIGNSLNHGTYKGSAKGFRLSSLVKLQQTKSSDGKTTVMDYLIQVLHARYVEGDLKAGNALSLNDELVDISKIKNINTEETRREVQDMKQQVEKLKRVYSSLCNDSSQDLIDTDYEKAVNIEQVSKFLSHAEQTVLSTESLKNELSSRCSDYKSFFGEEKDASVQIMNSLLSEFIEGFGASKKKFEDNLRRESKKRPKAS